MSSNLVLTQFSSKKNQMSKGTYLQYYVLILMMMVGIRY